jgi:hypothetical protein
MALDSSLRESPDRLQPVRLVVFPLHAGRAVRDQRRDFLRVSLGGITGLTDSHLSLEAAAALLNDMRQFVCQEFLACQTAGIVLSVPKEYILAGCESRGVQRSTKSVGFGTLVHPDS